MMTLEILFHMWEPLRRKIIDDHSFYVEQAHKRLLVHLTDLGNETVRFEKEWLQNNSHLLNPEIYDQSDTYELLRDESIRFQWLLDDMQNNTYLSVIAAIFYEWEKQFKNWIVKEMRAWNHGEALEKAVWKANFKELIELFSKFDWWIESKNYYGALNRSRMIVNVYKHGDGGSLEEIKKSFPELLGAKTSDDTTTLEYANYTSLRVDGRHLEECSNAIIEFWNDVPKSIRNTEELNLPKWFVTAYRKDRQRKV